MPFTYPAGRFPGVDPLPFSPFEPVIAEDPAHPDQHIAPVARWANRALAAGHCGTFLSASWADGQATVDHDELTTTLIAPYPFAPSLAHEWMRVTLRVRATLDGGFVGIDAGPGAELVLVVPAGVGPHVIEGDVRAYGDEGDLVVRTRGELTILSIEARWLPLEGVNGDWPDADDELPAEAIGEGELYPLDSDDFVADEYVSTDTLSQLYSALTHCRSRVHGIIGVPELVGVPLARRPLRGLLRVPRRGTTVTITLTVAAVDDADADGYIWIHYGRGGTGVVVLGTDGNAAAPTPEESPARVFGNLSAVVVAPGTGVERRVVTVGIPDGIGRVLHPSYPGGGWLAVFAEGCHLYGVSMWAR